jgi:hypothetical protein
MSVNYLLKDKSAPQSDIKCNSVNVNRLSAEKVSAANVADASPITFIAPNGQVFSFYEAIWTNAGSIGTDTSITLSVALPAGWDAEGQRPNISTESSNPQELYSLNQVVGNQLDFSVWNVSPSVVAPNVNRTIRILLA